MYLKIKKPKLAMKALKSNVLRREGAVLKGDKSKLLALHSAHPGVFEKVDDHKPTSNKMLSKTDAVKTKAGTKKKTTSTK